MLLSDLPIGTKVADVNSKYNNKIIIWTVASKNHYGNNQVTLISDILALKPSDAKEDGNSNSRNSYGNNRYSLSNIHSWLNSNKDNWYEAKHSLDAPPFSNLVTTNPYDTEKGFCTNLSTKFLNKVKTTTITTAIPTCDGGGSENISCKFYLPSLMEVGLGKENGISEGSQFPLFTDNASRIIEFGGAPREWELRTPSSNNGYDFRHIRPNGSNYTNVANNGYIGIRTVCNIDANIEVENKSSYYELNLSNYLNENASLSRALDVLEHKKEAIKGLKENLYNTLIENNAEVSESDSLETLVRKISDGSAFKKWASGTITTTSSLKKFYFISGNYENRRYISISKSNINFKPKFIIAIYRNTTDIARVYDDCVIYDGYGIDLYENGIVRCSEYSRSSILSGRYSYTFKADSNIITSDSYILPTPYVNDFLQTYEWYAFE